MDERGKKTGANPVSFAEAITIDQSLCTFCAGCSSVCPVMAIQVRDSSSAITSRCLDCGNCMAFCPVSAIRHTNGEGQ